MAEMTFTVTLVLERKNVAEIALEPICPNMRASARVDQLAGDANLSGDLADTALQNVTDTEFAPDLFDVDGPALVGKTRIAGDDEQKLERERAVMMSSTMPSAK